ncbi:unnamed protein product [Moneuplotes crassus]|uniref:DNA topoisomerase n=1 Tax=Euplotes crassus TaxID=5936 RepID=A0AAD1Y385_EUPCR|nr:unnamed protein product [Moneuplotes crassus]
MESLPQTQSLEETKATFAVLNDASEGEDSDKNEGDFNDSDFYDEKGMYKLGGTTEEKKTEKKKVRVKNPHNRLPTVEDEENSKFSMKFMRRTDYSNKQRKAYYDSLEIDMDALVWELGQIAEETGGINITMIAEKPSAAKEIANALSKAQCDKITRKSIERYEFYGKFKGIEAFFIVTSVYGFLYRTHYKKQVQSYDLDPHNFLDDQLTDYPSDFKERRRRGKFSTSNIMENLEYVLSGSHLIIFWTDNDVAGENICFEVLKFIQKRRIECQFQNTLRAQFSSLSHIEIRESFDDLRYRPDKAKSMACHARDVIDLRVGIAFTTFLTYEIQKKIGKNLAKRISYGPCQFPAFWFCYKRFIEIKNFEPYNYWRVKATLNTKNSDKIDVYLDEEFKEKSKAEEMVKKITGTTAIFARTDSQTVKIPKPQPINLLLSSSEELGYTASKTSRIAQTLYRKGMISYPRTNSRQYNYGFEYVPMLESFSIKGEYKHIAKDLLKRINKSKEEEEFSKYDIQQCRKNEYQAHPPVYPVSMPSKHGILIKDSDSYHLHNLVMKHFLSTLDKEAVVQTHKDIVKIGDTELYSQSSEFTENTFTKYYRPKGVKKLLKHLDKPRLTEEEYDICSITLEELQKPPPDFLSEPELIQLLEQHKIGTDGTIPDHINKIVMRKYVTEVNDPRCFIPTSLGFCLAEGFLEIQPELIHPDVRRFILNGCSKIENYELSYDSIQHEFIQVFRAKLNVFMSKFKKIKQNLERMQDIGTMIANVKKKVIKDGEEPKDIIDEITEDYLVAKQETFIEISDKLGPDHTSIST